ncbi:hypothetical protein OESDEN_22936 [Oesophagostomum dentatum]|uniref:Uncharacterized protein n=1 Tax=Oesophagostomum dentatum TaxID=61180 RepID=A0A0B1RXN2_OESDE|nr:hypothetical protein OESDEN_22936 [Oesophagostomum dentatum]
MTPGVEYVTYKSDCFYQTTLQVNPTNLSYVQGKACFPFQDGSAPVKRWFYCFCNDRDYCNSSEARSVLVVSVLLSLKYLFV